jgi:Cyclic nucleotide-binding domain/Major Facilitator Superfamily
VSTDVLRRSLQAVTVVFRNREMRLLQLAWCAESLATWSFAIALGVYAFDAAGATAVGIAGLARLLPGALAAPFGGLIGDRFSRRVVLVISALGNAALLGVATAAAAADAPTAVVFVLAGLSTVAISPYVPADGALMPFVAGTPQELSAANVAHSLGDNLGFLVAGVAGGVLLATASPQAVFGMAAIAGLITALLLARLTPDARPAYASETSGTILAEMARGARSLLADPRLRLVGTGLSLLVFFEGAADVLAVIVALDLLGLGQGAVGYLNAAWGIGALLSGAALAVLLSRGQLAVGLVLGCLIAGASLALPGVWVVAAAGYIAWVGMGFGYTLVEVVARTLMQRLGSDETLARALAFLETSRFAAMALGSVAVPVLIALFGVRGTLIVVGLILTAFALARWSALRALEIGAPVHEEHFRLLREHPIFAPLPIDTLERLSHDLVTVTPAPGEAVVTQGEPGERVYLIADGKVRVEVDGVVRRTHSEGECFGEIALLNDVPRTATVSALEGCRLLALDRDHFISAVTGHRRSGEAAASVVEDRLVVR